MPGQRKRKRQREREARRATARFAPEAGTWDVRFTTHDAEEFHAYIRRLRESEPDLDWETVRLDQFCGRLVHPDTYRLSVFVPDSP
ncbi:hypothetical protein [Streptomyces sp. NPDC051909]|uniref:hypothetical protein n=1 Tax=Streptomyces sp. NPDC051909 TaxID=3154944 RepID=UPI0034190F1C